MKPEPLCLTEDQWDTLCNVLARWEQLPINITQECMHEETIIVQFREMFIGIEPDGYAHS